MKAQHLFRTHTILNISFMLIVSFMLIILGLSCNDAQALAPASCNFPLNEFEDYDPSNLFELWQVEDDEGTDLKWNNLESCGAASTNFTGGNGNAFCVDAQVAGPAFDTTLETNEFTLRGATNAVFAYRISYDDLGAGGDRVDVDISDNGGTTWNTAFTYDFDAGVPFVSGTVGILSLNAYLGQDDMVIRFRYYDPTGGADSGSYVQIDTFAVACSGGADIQSSVSVDQSTVIEGQEVNYTYTFLNVGPITANNLTAVGSIPRGFSLLESEISTGIQFTNTPTSVGTMTGSTGANNAVTLNLKTRAVTTPQVNLDILSPQALAGNYEAFGASFGQRIDAANSVSGLVILADDGMMDANDGCEPLMNAEQAAGNIVFLENLGNCSFDEQIKNAEDAGAKAAIVTAIIPPFGFPPTPSPLTPLFGSTTGFEPITSSGNVTEPITIPSIVVSSSTGTAIQTNIVNGVNVRINGEDFDSQVQQSSGAAFAEEFDPDFASGGLFAILFGNTESNNFAFQDITVLRDTDGDGTPDQEDGCKRDVNKTSPLICGCQNPDDDLNTNGIIDCLSTEELKAKYDEAEQLIKMLKPNKGQKAIKKALRVLLSEIVSFTEANAQDILLINSGADLNKLSKQARRRGKKAIKNKLATFKKNKKLARKALRRAAKVLA